MTTGYPAGMEEEWTTSDDEFAYGDEDDSYRHFHSEPKPNLAGLTDLKLEAQGNTLNSTNIFDRKLVIRHVAEAVSLEGEAVRLAISRGDVEYVKKALDTGYEVDFKMASGWTALMYASSVCNVEIVKLLLSYQAMVNIHKDMFTSLMAACSSTCTDEKAILACVQVLVEFGANVDSHDQHLMTPLMYSSKYGRSQVAKLLIENAAQVNNQDTRGWTALAFGAANGFTHVVRTLLEARADISVCTHDGLSPADIAHERGFHLLADILSKCDAEDHNLLDTLPSVFATNTKPATSYVKYDDLELFLHGLQLGNLVQNFQEHLVTFPMLLKMSEKDMMDIGITQLGARRMLSDAIKSIHSEEWDLSSLSTNSAAKFSVFETAAILAIVAKHLMCIESTLVCVENQLVLRNEELMSDDVNAQKVFLEQAQETMKTAESLYKVVFSVHKNAMLLLGKKDLRPPDLLIVEQKRSHKSKIIIACSSLSLLALISVLSYGFVAKVYK